MDENDKILMEINLKLKEIDDGINKINSFVFNAETQYLNNTHNTGNLLKGWDHIFSSRPKLAQTSRIIMNKKPKILSSERIFSQIDMESFNKLEEENKEKICNESVKGASEFKNHRSALHNRKKMRNRKIVSIFSFRLDEN